MFSFLVSPASACHVQFLTTSELFFTLQMNIRKIIYLNCGETYEDMIDHRSFAHNLSSCEIKA